MSILETAAAETASSLTDETIELMKKLFLDQKGKQELISKLPDVKTLSRQEIIKKLSGYYQNERLVLVLGAGVSMGFGLPNWGTLL